MLRRSVVSRCVSAAAAQAAPTPKPAVTIAAGTYPEVDKIIETIPFVGAPLTALKSKGTYDELSEIRSENSFDPAAAVTTKFIENQKKLFAWRLHRARIEWLELLESPVPGGLSGLLILARTIVLSAIAYTVAFYFGSGGYGVELPFVGMPFGELPDVPKPLPWEGKK
ncbi:hypothetical protein DIPPA_20793 [Diplonema papillatum]|nr:hypothetical protein DIPPA_20793 [Diplonema papillatum]